LWLLVGLNFQICHTPGFLSQLAGETLLAQLLYAFREASGSQLDTKRDSFEGDHDISDFRYYLQCQEQRLPCREQSDFHSLELLGSNPSSDCEYAVSVRMPP
jgi:hypothetical protein